jgi:hypothetical protein
VKKVAPRKAPDLSEHSGSVQRQLGYDDREIERFIADRSIVQGAPAG